MIRNDLNFCTFLVRTNDDPAKLERTLLSLQRQVLDCQIMSVPPTAEAMKEALDAIDTRWVAFLEAGATVDERYVKWLKQYQGDWGCVIFRSADDKGVILPDRDLPSIDEGGVRLSFAIRTAVIDEFGLTLTPDDATGIGLLRSLQEQDIRLYVIREIGHRTGHWTVDEAT